jgi:hypothetical protein
MNAENFNKGFTEPRYYLPAGLRMIDRAKIG